MTNTVLDVRNLSVNFLTDTHTVSAVQNISFQVQRGKTLGIVGESGSGKSVTSLAIMGLLPTDSSQIQGEIYFQNDSTANQPVDLVKMPENVKEKYRGGQISMIFQEPLSSLNPVYTIGFQLIEAIKLHQNISDLVAKRQATSLLQEVKLLPSDQILRERCLEEIQKQQLQSNLPANSSVNSSPQLDQQIATVNSLPENELMQRVNQEKQAMLDRYPHELSGGQIQRVMIAMAISCNPTLLIADEPTTALDVTVQATILQLLRELKNNRGMSIIFITHDLGVISEIADDVAVMYQGKIVEAGPVQQIFTQPVHPYTKGLLACRPPLDRQVTRLATVADFMEVVTAPDGTIEIKEKATDFNLYDEPAVLREKRENHQPLLTVNNLRVGFPIKGIFGETKRLFMAVNDVSFEILPGKTLGVVGESGCGKSTLARAILQLIPITSGRVFFEQQEITPPVVNNISLFHKIQGLFADQTKSANQVQNTARQHAKMLRWLRRDLQIVFQDPFSSLDPRLNIGAAIMEPMVIHNYGKNYRERQERAAYLLERVGLNTAYMNRYPHEFSGGQRQRVCIARALALNPKLIICDESVSALDVSVQAQVLNLLKELQSELGLTYMFISHDLSVVKFMSDRIMVMNKGKIEEIDDAQTIYYDPQTAYTRQLIASIPKGMVFRVVK
jgi:peptide/nickel transport system ATP-binding protein